MSEKIVNSQLMEELALETSSVVWVVVFQWKANLPAKRTGNEELSDCEMWIVNYCKEKFKKMKADLVIIAFGMNDSALGAKKFASNVRELIEGIKSFCKETEFIVISSPSANKDCKLFYGQSEQFEELRKTFSGKITLINMSAASDFLMKRKKYIEISGNNLNHPNDFFYEFYESALSETLINAAESEN